jgi:hypothetical protein
MATFEVSRRVTARLSLRAFRAAGLDACAAMPANRVRPDNHSFVRGLRAVRERSYALRGVAHEHRVHRPVPRS